MSHSLSAMIFAASAFAFVTPLAATAKGYQPSTIDSKAIEGQCLLAKAANTQEDCEEKGKYWSCEAKSGWGYSEVSENGESGTSEDRDNWCLSNYSNNKSKCSCECNF